MLFALDSFALTRAAGKDAEGQNIGRNIRLRKCQKYLVNKSPCRPFGQKKLARNGAKGSKTKNGEKHQTKKGPKNIYKRPCRIKGGRDKEKINQI